MSENKRSKQKNEDLQQENVGDFESDGGIEMKKEKKTKEKKPYEYTEKRRLAYERMIAKKQEYQEKRRKEKEMGKAVLEPISKTLNKIQKLKEKARLQGFEVEDEPVKVKAKRKVVVDEAQDSNSEVEEVIIKKKIQPKKKKVVFVESDSEKHYNTQESDEEEVFVRRSTPKRSQPKTKVVQHEKKPYTITFV